VPTERLEQVDVGGLPEQAKQGDPELDRLPIRRFRDERAGQFIQPVVADAVLVDQRLNDRINDGDDVFGDDVLVNGGFVVGRGLAGVGKDQFDGLADGRLVLPRPEVVGHHPVRRTHAPAELRPGVDTLIIGKRAAVLGHARLVGANVGADELQDRGASVPGHRRRLVWLLSPEQSCPECHRNHPQMPVISRPLDTWELTAVQGYITAPTQPLPADFVRRLL
jgi:hypothetical protein